ncbi:hypothetical protein ACLI4Z_14230 [Natrialbaceae archaeon A-arb3/5]
MAYELRCDSCDLDRECSDWVDANKHASDHEAEHTTHWVSIRSRRDASPSAR